MTALRLTTALLAAAALASCAMAPPQIPRSDELHAPVRNPEIARPAPKSATAAAPASLDLAQALSLAYDANPALRADYLRAEALLLDVPQVSSLDDPMAELSAEESFRGPDEEREAMLGVSQTIPWFGKRRLRGLIAGSEAAEAVADYRMAVLELRRDISSAWWRALHARENAVLLEEERRLVAEARNATLALYQSGMADRTALLRLDAEGAMIAGLGHENEGAGRAAVHELSRLLSVPVTDGALVGDIGTPAPLAIPDENALLDTALDHRPELAALAESGNRASLQERLARADYYPDFTIGAGLAGTGMQSRSFFELDPDSRTDSWQGSLGIVIPVPNARRRAAVEQARKRGEEARLRLNAMADQVLQELGAARSMVHALQHQLAVYDTSIVPIAEDAFLSTRSAYQSGAAQYADLIDVQRTLVAARREQLRMRRDLLIATAELERALGAPLPTAAPLEAPTP